MAQQQQQQGVVGVSQMPNTLLSLQPKLLQQGQQPYSQGLVQVLQVPQQLQLSPGHVVMQGPQVLPAVQQYNQPHLQSMQQPQQQVVYIAQQPHLQQQPAGQTAVEGMQEGYQAAAPQWQQQQQVGAVAAQPLGPQQQQLLSMPGMALQQQHQPQLVQGIQSPQQQLQHPGYVVLPASATGVNQAAEGQQATWGLAAPYHQAEAQGAMGSAAGNSGRLQLVNVLAANASGGYGMGVGALAVAGAAAPPSSAALAPVLVYDMPQLQAAVGTGNRPSDDPPGLPQPLQAPGVVPAPSPTAAGAGSVVGAVGAPVVGPGGPGHVQLQQQGHPQQQLILQQLMQQLGLVLQEPQ
jgi:hypothetical protein